MTTNILVAGGGGYIGSALVPVLQDHGYNVTVVDLMWFGDHLPKDTALRKKDIFDCTEKDLEGFDQVIYLGGLSNDPSAEYDSVRNFIYNASLPAYLALMAKRAGVKRFIYASTCHDEKTMLVTKSGIKKYSEILHDDIVFSFNPETNKIEEVPIEKMICMDYEGKMIKFKGRRMDICTTPDHTFFYKTSNLEHRKYQTTTADDLQKKSHVYFPHPTQNNEPVLTSDIQNLAYLIGLFIGDGYIVHTHNTGINKSGLIRSEYLKECRDSLGRFKKVKVNPKEYNYEYTYIEFAIPANDPARKKLIDTLVKNGIKYNANDKIRVQVYNKELEYIFRDCGKGAKNKCIPPYLLDGSHAELSQLFNGLMDSDGSRGRLYTTASSQLKDDFCELCIKLGYRPYVKYKITKSPSSDNQCGAYTISVGKTIKSLTKRNMSEIDYKGKVWCLSVKNKNFLTVRNGRYAFTGNCSVYGYTVNELYDEESKISCNYPYGVSKLQGEKGVMHLQDENFSAICLRKGTVSGHSPRMRYDLIINIMFLHAVTKGEITVNNPAIWRPIVSVKDVISAYLRSIQADYSISGVFNIAHDNYTVGEVGYTVKDIVEQYAGEEIKLKVKDVHDVRNYKVTIEKARTTLGFHPRHSVADIVQELLDHWPEFMKVYKEDRFYNINVCKNIFTDNKICWQERDSECK